ncbi:MAG: SDR family NAD(P)-dependent oxidoreductase [Candidatus Peribacteria bacterium]|nr:MAG: SDR family NAD(P)-dependent oxidoreductase [Candidatus Peribacteria bacterium]
MYGASKAAITSYTNSSSQELAPYGIKVMGIYPGGMDTKIFETS